MRIKNTTETEQRLEWLGGGNPSVIEQQEARGQQQLVEASQLPARGLDLERAEALGIRVIGPSAGDLLFVDVELPPTLTKRATDHAMWTDLVSADGAVVASIFYKAAFYDRKAFIRFE